MIPNPINLTPHAHICTEVYICVCLNIICVIFLITFYALFYLSYYCDIEAQFLNKEEALRWGMSWYFWLVGYHCDNSLNGLNIDELEYIITLVFTEPEHVHRKSLKRTGIQ